MKLPLLIFLTIGLIGCGKEPLTKGDAMLAKLERLPIGMTVMHTPSVVTHPNNSKNTGWPYTWSFKTEITTEKKSLRIAEFGIIAWDGKNWILPLDNSRYNNGIMDQKTFIEWYGNTDGLITPSQPAVDKQNWAGSKLLLPFKQKWFYIGIDNEGNHWKGEGVIHFETSPQK